MFLGIDLGTGSVKALLLSEQGRVLSEASVAYQVTAPFAGWAETAPDAWWQATCQAVKQCCQGFEVRAISFSGQMHGTVLCDTNGEALRPAILWADTRAHAYLQAYKRLSAKHLKALANPIITGMMGVSLLWLKDNEAGLYRQASCALQPKDWLRLKFTGVLATDPSDASATLLYDLSKDTWAHDIVTELGLRSALLTEIVPSQQVIGQLSANIAVELGLRSGIPVITGGADAACSAFGSGLRQEGQVQINIGTAMQIFAIREQAQADERLQTHLFRTVEDNYYAMAAMKNAGLAFEWVRSVLGMSWPEMYQEAFGKVSDAEGLVFLPYLTGENTPYFNAQARGTWHGLGLQHRRGHMARAAFEGVAFALKDGLAALEQTGIRASVLRLAGGGSQKPQWQQLLADILAKPLLAVDSASASARGAALLAAGGLGFEVDSKAPELVAEPRELAHFEASYERFRDLYQRLYVKPPGERASAVT